VQILVSDANVLIDLEVCDLAEEAFRLPISYLTPDILFLEELKMHHSNLLDLGLKVVELSPNGVENAMRLVARYPKPSRNDIIALATAQEQRCALLTGDQDLREVAERENVVVHGTLWLVETIVKTGEITVDRAFKAYEAMKKHGRRLPWATAKRRLDSRLR